MTHNLDHTISLLARTPPTLDALLRDLPESFTRANEGENTWTAFDVVGHLNHAERADWIPRALIILKHANRGPSTPSIARGMFGKFKASPSRSCWTSSPICAPKT